MSTERRRRLYEIIFEADTPAGKLFDIALIWCIVLSVAAVILDSVASLNRAAGPFLSGLEWFFTALFTVEYILRLLCVKRPAAYARSFYGIVDLLAVVPTYLSIIIPGTQTMLTIRTLRLLRVFRVFKLAGYVREAGLLSRALRASSRKISVFLAAVIVIIIIVGSLMYVIEGAEHGFTDIPTSMYWAVVTLTTVGYGDISPQTPVGKVLASVLMIVGYGIIAVPTGIFSAEMVRAGRGGESTHACPSCGADGHDSDARHCKFCGAELSPPA